MKRTFLLFALAACFTTAQAQKIFTVAGNGTSGRTGDGTIGAATTSQIEGTLRSIMVDNNNRLVFFSGTSRLRSLDVSTGTLNAVAGNGSYALGADNVNALTTNWKSISGNCYANGEIYFMDDQTWRLRKIDAGNIVRPVAGTGTQASANLQDYNDGQPAASAKFFNPGGIAVDKAGNIYISDDNVIRKIDVSTGNINKICGAYYNPINGNPGSGHSGDNNLASSALTSHSLVMKCDAFGNLIFLEGAYIRKIEASTGKIFTIAGNGIAGNTGNGGAATSASINPWDFDFDEAGNIYFADAFDKVVRKITPGGVISLYAGSGSSGYGPECASLTSANLDNIDGIAVDKNGEVYLSFSYYISGSTTVSNYRIVKLSNGDAIGDVSTNSLCSPGFSTPAVTPQLTVSMIGGRPPYTYAWTANTGNGASLSSTSVGNPTVTAVATGKPLDYTLSVTDGSTCLSAVTRKVVVHFNETQNFDLAMRDSYYDMMDEANSQSVVDPNKWNVWESPDVWNRLLGDGVKSNQPGCAGSCTNYMYTTVRNVGCLASPSTAKVKLYWTVGGTAETWDADWISPGNSYPGTSLPAGSNIGVASVPVLNPGQTSDIHMSWTPPTPTDYFANAKEMEVCFLSRVIDGHNSLNVDGMTTAEGLGLSNNVRNNNNIVTRNSSVVMLSSYTPRYKRLLVGNSELSAATYGFELINSNQDMLLMNYMHIVVHLGSLFDDWFNNGAVGTYAAFDPGAKTVTFDGSHTMSLSNIPFNESQENEVGLEFIMDPAADGTQMPEDAISFHQIAKDALNQPYIYGNYTYYVKYYGFTDSSNSGNKQIPTSVTNNTKAADFVRAYPNPTTNLLHFVFNGIKEGKLELLDIAGRVVYSKENIHTSHYVLSTTQFESGTYIYKMYIDGKVFSDKVVISH